MLLASDLLLIGRPSRQELLQNMPVQVVIRPGSFSLHGKLYDQPSVSFFSVFRHPYENERTAALFLTSSTGHPDDVTRKITHYGKYSYLVFKGARNKNKGVWLADKSPLIYQWEK